MILSDSAILEEIANGNIVISPFERSHLNPNSVDLTLGNTLRIYDKGEMGLTYYMQDREYVAYIDAKKDNPTIDIEIPETGFILMPDMLYLGHTNEIAGSKKYHTELRGKSSIARLGIFIDCTANFGDVGFVNIWTLEISVVEPVKIYPNMRIAQIKFTDVLGEVLVPYDKKPDSKYNGDNKAVGSQMFKNFKK